MKEPKKETADWCQQLKEDVQNKIPGGYTTDLIRGNAGGYGSGDRAPCVFAVTRQVTNELLGYVMQVEQGVAAYRYMRLRDMSMKATPYDGSTSLYEYIMLNQGRILYCRDWHGALEAHESMIAAYHSGVQGKREESLDEAAAHYYSGIRTQLERIDTPS